MTTFPIAYREIVQAPAREIMHAFMDRLPMLEAEADRYAEGCDLAGEGGGYRDIQAELSHLIGALKRVHRALGNQAGHQHDWNESDYCVICGRDGRA